jgi:hypothetical protein
MDNLLLLDLDTHSLLLVKIILIIYLDDQLIIFGGWSCNSGRRFNAISSTSDNEYNEEKDYFYSLNTLTLTWQKSKFNGDLPTSNIITIIIF